MQYLGGKARLRDQIVPIINSIDANIYIEPFCGACWVGEKVDKKYRILSDANYYLIEMWKALKKGWIPPKTCSEEEYARIRQDDSDPSLHAWICIAQSYGGRWGGGYARRHDCARDYTLSCFNQTMKRLPNLLTADFQHKNYSSVFKQALKVEKPMVMYLDPPYAQTTGYAKTLPFDSDIFWKNVRLVSRKHYVLTSSYEAPADLTCVREWYPRTGMNVGRNEKLFCCGKILEDYELT
jgi:site-specific DNA-adenine methylase